VPITTCWTFARVSSGATVALKCSRDVTSNIECDGHVITDATDEFGVDRTSEYLPVAGFQEVRIEYFLRPQETLQSQEWVLREFNLEHTGLASAIERISGLGAVLMETTAEASCNLLHMGRGVLNYCSYLLRMRDVNRMARGGYLNCVTIGPLRIPSFEFRIDGSIGPCD